jgi:hypothetical protein
MIFRIPHFLFLYILCLMDCSFPQPFATKHSSHGIIHFLKERLKVTSHNLRPHLGHDLALRNEDTSFRPQESV